jgi:8-oxo-dGTP pyrophosphatase MutT (NUDIX family)
MSFFARTAHQVAVLPFREDPDQGGIAFLMVTSRRRGRWIMPKGWPEQGESLSEAARREAREEAGVDGEIADQMVGRYRYTKQMRDGYDLPCMVSLYPLHVTTQQPEWKEKGERQVRWMSPSEAAANADDPDLSDLLARLAEHAPDDLLAFLKNPKPLSDPSTPFRRFIQKVARLFLSGLPTRQTNGSRS